MTRDIQNELANAENSGSKLQKNTVILDLRYSRPGATRKGSLDGVDIDADKDSLRLSKEYLRSPHYKRLVSIEAEIKKEIRKFALQSPFREGMFVLPIAALEVIYPRLESAQQDVDETANKLEEDWPLIVADAKKRLRSQFRASEYPSAREIRRRCGMSFRLLSLQTPDQDTLGEVFYEREREKFLQTWKEAEADVVDALRAGLLELIETLLDRLKPDADGSVKRLHESRIKDVEEFLNNFSKRNVMGDAELEGLVNKARKVLRGVDVKDIRKNEDSRVLVSQGLKKVSRALGELVGTSKRKIRFED